MQDLDIRGAGNLLGAEQSGFIADIGFETYQKIRQEAIAELRSEGLEMPGMSDAEQGVVDKMSYISDSVIEIDVEAELPTPTCSSPPRNCACTGSWIRPATRRCSRVSRPR